MSHLWVIKEIRKKWDKVIIFLPKPYPLSKGKKDGVLDAKLMKEMSSKLKIWKLETLELKYYNVVLIKGKDS